MESKYLTVKEAAKYCRICETIFRRWTNMPDFYPAIRLGERRITINREALDRWLEEQGQKGA